MARLFITMTDDIAVRGGDQVPMYSLDQNEEYESVAISTTQATSSALSRKYARITTDTACHVAFGENAVRTAGSEVGTYLSAGSVLDVEVKKGVTTVSVIQAA